MEDYLVTRFEIGCKYYQNTCNLKLILGHFSNIGDNNDTSKVMHKRSKPFSCTDTGVEGNKIAVSNDYGDLQVISIDGNNANQIKV